MIKWLYGSEFYISSSLIHSLMDYIVLVGIEVE